MIVEIAPMVYIHVTHVMYMCIITETSWNGLGMLVLVSGVLGVPVLWSAGGVGRGVGWGRK